MGFMDWASPIVAGLGAYAQGTDKRIDMERQRQREDMQMQMQQMAYDDAMRKRQQQYELANAIRSITNPYYDANGMMNMGGRAYVEAQTAAMAPKEATSVANVGEYGDVVPTEEEARQNQIDIRQDMRGLQRNAQMNPDMSQILPVLAQYDPEKYMSIINAQRQAQAAAIEKRQDREIAQQDRLAVKDRESQNRVREREALAKAGLIKLPNQDGSGSGLSAKDQAIQNRTQANREQKINTAYNSEVSKLNNEYYKRQSDKQNPMGNQEYNDRLREIEKRYTGIYASAGVNWDERLGRTQQASSAPRQSAPQSVDDLKVGQVYTGANGKRARWTGTGFEAVN